MVLNSRGESCDVSAKLPAKLWYNYIGTTDSKSTEAIFLIAQDNSTTSMLARSTFQQFFSADGSLKQIFFNYINFGVNGKLLSGLYNGTIGYAASRRAPANVTVSSPIMNSTGGYLNITRISMTLPGQVYFGIGTNNSVQPSQEQLMNCEDGLARPLLGCSRLIVALPNIVTFGLYSDKLAFGCYSECKLDPIRDILHASKPVSLKACRNS